MEACDNDAAQDGLRHGAFDAILFVADGAEPWDGYTPLIEAPPCCLVAADHPLAGRPTVALRDLAEMPIVDGVARETFAENGVEIADMTQEEFDAWRAIAQETAYAAFLEGSPEGQRLLDLALSVE